jgi:hypothetical protein
MQKTWLKLVKSVMLTLLETVEEAEPHSNQAYSG